MHRFLSSWTIVLAVADARLLRPDRTPSVMKKAASVEHAKRLLERAPVSCMSFDPSSGSARFSIGPEDLYDPAELFQDVRTLTDCKEKGEAAAGEVALMVPTYPNAQIVYNLLVGSIRQNVQGPAVFISIFSSINESKSMLQFCGDACWAEEGSTSRENAPPRFRSLVFNYGWQDIGDQFQDKANYQSSKKFWGIFHSRAEKVLMLDSDFKILRPIVLQDAIAPYEHVVFEMDLDDYNVGDRGCFAKQMEDYDTLFGTHTTPPQKLHFDMPWIYHREMVDEFVAFMKKQTAGKDVWEYMVKLEYLVFEVVLYRRFVLYKSTQPHFFSTVHTDKLWFEEYTNATEEMRLKLTPPPIGIRNSTQRREPCQICWLSVHADRDP